MSSTLIIRCVGVTLKYPSLKSGKYLIYAYFHESKHHNFGYLCYGILVLEHINVNKHIYNKSTNYILDLLDFVGQYPTIKLGTRKLVSKRIIRGIDGRRKVMRTQ